MVSAGLWLPLVVSKWCLDNESNHGQAQSLWVLWLVFRSGQESSFLSKWTKVLSAVGWWWKTCLKWWKDSETAMQGLVHWEFLTEFEKCQWVSFWRIIEAGWFCCVCWLLLLASHDRKWWKILPQAKARSGPFCVWTEFFEMLMQSQCSFFS